MRAIAGALNRQQGKHLRSDANQTEEYFHVLSGRF